MPTNKAFRQTGSRCSQYLGLSPVRPAYWFAVPLNHGSQLGICVVTSGVGVPDNGASALDTLWLPQRSLPACHCSVGFPVAGAPSVSTCQSGEARPLTVLPGNQSWEVPPEPRQFDAVTSAPCLVGLG